MGDQKSVATGRAVLLKLFLFFFLFGEAVASERFLLSIPGPTLSYTHLFYGQEKGFFSQEGLDLQVLVVRGQIGISSLMSGEIDVTCHAGSGFAAALRGLPLKVISVTRDRPYHELIVALSIHSPADLKGKPVVVGSLEGTAAVIARRVLQAKGLDPQKDVMILSTENTAVRYQSLLTGKVAGAMLTPPSTYLALDQGFRLFGRGRDYMRYLQTGIVTTDTRIKQKRGSIVRFLRAWNRALKYYRENPEVMIPYIQKKFSVNDVELAKRMYQDDLETIVLTGRLNPQLAAEILETGKEALKISAPVPLEKIFDFSLTDEANR